MRILSLVQIQIGLPTLLILPVAAGAIGWWRAWTTGSIRLHATAGGARATWIAMSRATRIVCLAAGTLLLVRMITLAIESLSRPFFPWEAVSGVAVKARVWYELGHLAPFAPPVAILQGLGQYTDADPTAMSLPSLLLVWTAHAIGQWQEGVVAFPWWMFGVAIGLAFYGHLRRSGAGIASSLVFVYVLLSIPLVDMHIALSGAPQWIGVVGVGLAGCAFMRWTVSPSRELPVCFLIGTVLATLSLASTWPWFAIFLIAGVIQGRRVSPSNWRWASRSRRARSPRADAETAHDFGDEVHGATCS
jgi:hypothetical protein